MKPNEVAKYINKVIDVNSRSISGKYRFTAYIFRIVNNKKFYQAEVQNINPPHEIYVVPLNDLLGGNEDEKRIEDQ